MHYLAERPQFVATHLSSDPTPVAPPAALAQSHQLRPRPIQRTRRSLHRLPTGIFYSQGVKANVLFFDHAPAGENIATEALWVYDLRTNQRFTLRERPLKRADLDEFVTAYGKNHRQNERVESERFHRFSYEELAKRDKLNLDIFWLKDASATDPDSLPPPER